MYTYTGYERAFELKILRTVGGVETYQKTYRVLDEFLNYPAIELNAFARISLYEYEDRMNAFKHYVESLEVGVTVDLSAARRENETACPIL